MLGDHYVRKESQNMWHVWLSKMILAEHSFFAQFAEAGEKKKGPGKPNTMCHI
jgi:hypothetical protein